MHPLVSRMLGAVGDRCYWEGWNTKYRWSKKLWNVRIEACRVGIWKWWPGFNHIFRVLTLVEMHKKETILSKTNIVGIEKCNNSEFGKMEILKLRDNKICQHSESFSAGALWYKKACKLYVTHMAHPQVHEAILQAQEVNSDSVWRICINTLILKQFLFSYFSISVRPSGTDATWIKCGMYTDWFSSASQAVAYEEKSLVSLHPVLFCTVWMLLHLQCRQVGYGFIHVT